MTAKRQHSGSVIRAARQKRELHLAFVAGYLRVSSGAISRFERTGQGLGEKKMKKLAGYFGLTFKPSQPAEILPAGETEK